MIIDKLADCLLSIESAKLEWKTGVDRRRIYGDVNINGCLHGNALFVYHRTVDEAETSSESSNILNLTLYGPRYSVQGREPTFLYVDLHEAGVGPLIQERVPLNLPEKGINNPIEVVARGPDGSCVLAVYMTALAPAVMATTELLLLDDDEELPSDQWLVSGTVSAVQKSSYKGRDVERIVPLFSRPESCPVRTLGQGGIPLDRRLAVAPMERDHGRVRKLHDLTYPPGYSGERWFLPEDPIYGKGSSLAIRVDLKLVLDRGDRSTCCVLSATPKFEVKGCHQVVTRYEQYVVGAVGDGHQSLTLKVSLTTLHHLYPHDDIGDDINHELFEEDLPLYLSNQGARMIFRQSNIFVGLECL